MRTEAVLKNRRAEFRETELSGSCRYHGEQDECRADMIEVVCPCTGADCESDTSCATFSPES